MADIWPIYGRYLEIGDPGRAITDPFEQSFFLLVHISYLQAFVDVNQRTARLTSIIPLVRNDYVPQSFVDVDQDVYLEATIAVYEFNEVGPLADVYAWSYRRSCQRYDTTAQVVGFDEIAALYRTSRRDLVTASRRLADWGTRDLARRVSGLGNSGETSVVVTLAVSTSLRRRGESCSCLLNR